MSNELELGTLIVVVLKARNLNDKHSFYKQDAFAQISLNGTAHRTPVDVKGGQHPVWDAEIRVPVLKDSKEKNRFMEVSCWSKEPKTDDILGESKVDISETLKTGEFDDWVPLTINGVNRGDLYLEMTFYAHGPPKASLAVPTKSDLNGRPSKLNPSERLWRPASKSPPRTSQSSSPSHSPGPSRSSRPHNTNSVIPQNNYLGPPSSSSSRPRSSSSSPSPSTRHQDHLVPPNPDARPPAIPPTLLPAFGARRQPQSSRSSSSPPARRQESPLLPEIPPANTANPYLVTPGAGVRQQFPSPSAPQLPSTLRPGNLSSISLTPSRPLERPTQARNPSSNPQSLTPPYLDTGYSSSLPIPPYQPPNAVPPPERVQPLISFPVPQTPVVSSTYEYRDRDASHYPNARPPSYDTRNDSPAPPSLPDPFLHARYASPLPLPPGSRGSRSSPPRGQQPPSGSSDVDFSRRQALLKAEEEAARRKWQEDQDLELARQLDRELNLG